MQYVPVNPAAGQVGEFVQVLVNEALVVAQIQVGLHTVLGYKYLTVLVRAHGARVHIHIRIQLLSCHLQAALFEQPPKAGRADALA